MCTRLRATSSEMDSEEASYDVSLRDMHARMEENPAISKHSTYWQIRRPLVNWVADVCQDLGMKPMMVHCATCFLDRYMHKSNLSQQYRLAKYHAFAAAAVLIAAKLEERAEKVPLISEIVQTQSASISPKDVSEAEIQILISLSWRTSACTCLHFLDIRVHQGVCSQGKRAGGPITAKDQQAVIKYMYFYADMCLLQAEFSHFSTALNSAAIIAAARQTVRIEPVWTTQLHATTGFSADELEQCVDLIRNEFCRTWPESVPGHLHAFSKLSLGREHSAPSESASSRSSSRSLSSCDSEMADSVDSIEQSELQVKSRMRKRILGVIRTEQGENPSDEEEVTMDISESSWQAPAVPARKSNLKTGQLLLL